MIPIFDSLSHPTISGNWIHPGFDCSFASLEKSLKANGFIGAAAVGLYGVEGYDNSAFIKKCQENPALFPVAGFSPAASANITAELAEIKKLGYKAIKLHPRIGNFCIDAADKKLNECLNEAQQNGLIVFLCTYFSSEINKMPDNDPYWELVKLLKKYPKLKIVLLHGGLSRLMMYADLARFNANILLDLSYTIMKYKGSSLDADIQYLFKNFDKKICIGTDHPEFSHTDLRKRLKDFENNMGAEKLENIYHKSIKNFLGIL